MIYFFHGLESGPNGSKKRALEQHFGAVQAPDFRGLDLEGRVNKALEATEGDSDIVVVGSSFGGLVASLLHQQRPLRALVLCAPAFLTKWVDMDRVKTLPDLTVIIHGSGDQVVPIEASESVSEKIGVKLTVVDDTHRLSDSNDVIIQSLRELLITQE